jgi:Amt family ammonium transporter
MIRWRTRTRLDDSLDVVAAHGLGGLCGALLTGVFAEKAWGGTDGLLAGNPWQVVIQAVGVVATMAYSGTASFLILKAIGAVVPLRTGDVVQATGMDLTMHEEEAYASGEGAVLLEGPGLFDAEVAVVPGLSTSPTDAAGGVA